MLVAFCRPGDELQDVASDGARFNGTFLRVDGAGGLKMESVSDRRTDRDDVCVVTFVSLMVHIYTIGYMATKIRVISASFSYISLFTFSMLMLVMSNNSPAVLRLGGGGPGVYLLIGFWLPGRRRSSRT